MEKSQATFNYVALATFGLAVPLRADIFVKIGYAFPPI
jgi:hypothetical protein